MKVYSGWVLLIDGTEYQVGGSMKIRGVQSYYLTNLATGEVKSIRRSVLLEEWGKSVTYVR